MTTAGKNSDSAQSEYHTKTLFYQQLYDISIAKIFSYQKIFFEFLFQNDKQIDGNNLNSMTETGLEKQFATGLFVPLRTFRSAPLSTVESPLLILRQKFERENSHVPQSDTQSFIG